MYQVCEFCGMTRYQEEAECSRCGKGPRTVWIWVQDGVQISNEEAEKLLAETPPAPEVDADPVDETESLFMCPIVGCDKSFKTEPALKAHLTKVHPQGTQEG